VPRNRVGRSGEGRPSPAAFHTFAALLLISCLAFAGCGLDTTTTFFDAPSFSNSGSFVLQHNTLNSEINFYGYNVYYRVYSDQNAASADLNTISITVQNTGVYTPSTAFTYLTNSPPNGLGYLPLRINVSTADIVPNPFFVVSNKSIPTTYQIQTPPISQTNWFYTTSSTGPTKTTVVRNNSGTVGSTDSFNSTYFSGQIDYSGAGAVANSTIYIIMFAVAYGIDPSTFSTIYSFPSLGAELQYQLPGTLNGW
jgi:hypothetical protein